MTQQIWSWVLSAIGITGLWLVGSGRRWGWLVNLAAQVLWVIYSLNTGQYGFILGSIAYTIVFARNYRKAGKT